MKEMDSDVAISIFNAAVGAVQPCVLVPAIIQLREEVLLIGEYCLPLKNYDGVYVLSAGKAGAAMAQEVEKILGSKISAGLVITKYHHSLPLAYCQTIEAGHPVPDENSLAAAHEIQQFLLRLTPNSLLLCCISGGASALIADIAEGIGLPDMRTTSNLLLQCGAEIHEINVVRKHLSFLKGGQLVKLANGAAVFSLIISDVVGDDVSIIASGLTVADPSTYLDARQVLEKYALTQKIPASVQERLVRGINGTIRETPKPADALFNQVRNQIIGNNTIALNAAALQAEKMGFTTIQVNNVIQGEARDAAIRFVDVLLGYKGKRPACFLAGGETTVTIKGNGKGGRNQEFALAALCRLMHLRTPPDGWPVILCGGTDGTDGPTPAAGAIVNIKMFLHILKSTEKPEIFLENNNSFNFFKPFGALFFTGATQTNVMDVIIGLIQ